MTSKKWVQFAILAVVTLAILIPIAMVFSRGAPTGAPGGVALAVASVPVH